MSIRQMTAVFDHSQARLADRLVLLVIADKSDDDGTGCFRGRESIARMAGVTTRQVSRSIARLRELGELDVTERPGHSSQYRITLATPVATLDNLSGVTTPTLDRMSTHPGQIVQTPLSKLSTDTSSNTSSYTRTKNASQSETVQIGRPNVERPDVELHHADDDERERVATVIADLKAKFK